MKARIFTLMAIILGLIACETGSDEMNAQESSWHLIAMDLDGAELATFSLKNSKPPVLDGDKVDILNTWNNKTYSFDIDETLFAFDVRQEGSATRNESISAEKLSVSYYGNRLCFSQPVKSVYIYNYTGVLIDRPTGSGTDFRTSSLSVGNYIIKTDKGTFKINVNETFSGGAEAQVQTRAGTVPGNAPIQTSSGVSADADDVAPYYWNISDGTTSIPIDVSQVAFVRFSEGTIIVEYKNGSNSMGMGYKSSDFATQPVQATSQWDLEKTLAIGGGTYGFNDELNIPAAFKVEFISAISKTEIVIYDVTTGKETKYSRNGIPSDLINKDGARISFMKGEHVFPAISYYYVDEIGTPRIFFQSILDKNIWGAAPVMYYNFNDGTNKLPSTFITNADGSLTVKYKNADGTARQYTFK